MDAYFDNHSAGLLLVLAIGGWAVIEASQAAAGRKAADQDTKGSRSLLWRYVNWTTLAVCSVMVHLAPHLVPAAAIRPGASAFAAGLVIMLAGMVLRGWSFLTLGKYFTFTVIVTPDQPVMTAGPYRVLRHPSYAGALLICAGIGLASANLVGLAVLTVLPLALLLWRIHLEESALVATLGDAYRRYAAGHKRLVPLVW